ncbi:NADPH-dependent FMN reductase family protein (plasmid) [Sinorhizobium fredii NGR234]|uniref:NADPH-dependent FMN reductase family protein n=1 Tax=Sinorhizobium fredii (strain NBRC 101917 / NGR234) TaxID=394 RepID=C3KNJ0_SINFN|nr:NAD(P)H-dependent oxidoreductase [Sinorhizobium fredii]ACP21648.1 NADPH-dependent FMN reductase family protein [Sinorhizobium fredii NGR234]
MFGEPTEKNSVAPLIVGLGGTTRDGSSTELALRYALNEAEQAGARTMLFNGQALMMPMYAPEVPHRTAEAQAFIAALRAADGIIIASPAYHGSISGLVKNALDYTEDMRNDAAAYLDGRAVGCITCAYGPQAAGTTLVALRSIVHALRGWPTPLGVGINSATCRFSPEGEPSETAIADQLKIMATQVAKGAFAMRAGLAAARKPDRLIAVA